MSCCPDFNFTAAITPLTTPVPATVSFKVRRRDCIVTLQWEPFIGTIGTTGITHLTINTVLPTEILPPYRLSAPIIFAYQGVSRIGYIWLDSTLTTDNFRIYLNADSSNTGVTAGDSVSFTGGSITWIL